MFEQEHGQTPLGPRFAVSSPGERNQGQGHAAGVAVRLPNDLQQPPSIAGAAALGVGQRGEIIGKDQSCVQSADVRGDSVAEVRDRIHIESPMPELKPRFDIFICGGSQHVNLLEPLLERLLPYGTVHLASSFLSAADIGQLHGRYDVLHRPAHSLDGYANFELFCIKDLYRVAAAPYFIKLDADVTLADDWIEYVEACIAAHPHAVLMGPWKGDVDIDVELSGAPIRRRLRRDVRVTGGLKVIGGFCVARTAFFKEQIELLEIIHEGVLSSWRGDATRREPITVRGRVGKRGSLCSEDTLRSLVVHAVDASDRLRVIDSGGRIGLNR